MIAAALVGAIIWNLLTWRLGIPSSSSHALIGGLLGAALVSAGIGSWQIDGVLGKVLLPLVGSPLIGFSVGLLLMALIFNVFRRAHPGRLNARTSGASRCVSAGYMAFSHGSNDAQKTMGIMTLALVTAGVIQTTFEVAAVGHPRRRRRPSAWGRRRAAGESSRPWAPKVVKLDPVHGFAAETTAATVIFGASHFGMPVSTTHVISSRDHGRRLVRSVQDRSLGRGPLDRDRVDPHHPRVRHDRRGGLPAPQPDPRLAKPADSGLRSLTHR